MFNDEIMNFAKDLSELLKKHNIKLKKGIFQINFMVGLGYVKFKLRGKK